MTCDWVREHHWSWLKMDWMTTSVQPRMTFTLLLLVLIASYETSGRRDDLIINTDKGRIRGIRYHLPQLDGKAVDAFLGIPFAKAPVGHLRFKHPQPIDTWTGIYNATKLPNSCYQKPDDNFGDFRGSTMWNPNTRVSEDCLYLNVWVPKTHPRLRRSAVMVWIYGGGFYSGTTTLNLYDGKILAAENNIIVVSIGYRVGALGFLALGDAACPGNAGLFDQLMGLEWVQQNINHFGGDPNNVTIFGESSGSVSVSIHLLSPLSRTKFSRAIMQSGTANMPWGTVTMEEGKRRSLELAFDYLGCSRSDNMEKVVECLRSVPPQRLVDEQWVTRGILQFPFVPVIDGSFLVETPEMTLLHGNFKKCPILLGSNLNEGSFFLIYELPDLLQLNRSRMPKDAFEASVLKLFHYYPQYPRTINSFGTDAIIYKYTNWLDRDNQLWNLIGLDNSVGDFGFTCNVNEFAQTYASAGEMVYYYYFTYRYASSPWPSWMGVLHGDEIVFTFGDPLKPGLNYSKEEVALSREIMTYWTNFAKTG